MRAHWPLKGNGHFIEEVLKADVTRDNYSMYKRTEPLAAGHRGVEVVHTGTYHDVRLEIFASAERTFQMSLRSTVLIYVSCTYTIFV